jgi:hypothetical protein
MVVTEEFQNTPNQAITFPHPQTSTIMGRKVDFRVVEVTLKAILKI